MGRQDRTMITASNAPENHPDVMLNGIASYLANHVLPEPHD